MAKRVDIAADQYDVFSSSVELWDENGDPLDVTGYTANGAFARHWQSANVYPIACTLDIGVLEFSFTTNIPSGMYVYDIQMYSSNGMPSKVAEGLLQINPSFQKN